MTPDFDRATFLRPIAHRGLYGQASGAIENTGPAFLAAIAKGFGIECDLRPAAGGLPIVFHDALLDRLIDGTGPVSQLTRRDLGRLRYRGHDTPILTLTDLFDLVAGRTPLLVEVKSDWRPSDPAFMKAIARAAAGYKGPIALTSFDPDILAAFVELAPGIPRGIVSQDFEGVDWWKGIFDESRAYRLTHLLESRRAAPSFFAYDVRALPTPRTRFVREVLGLPLFAWTVRTEKEWRIASTWADAPIFEERT